MSTYERKTKIEDPRIRPGWEVTYHEVRGYDSPDKWHEVRFKGKLVETLGRGPQERERAIQIAMEMLGRGPREQANQTAAQRLQVTVASDDLISYTWNSKDEEVGSPEMDFKIRLPGGTMVPLKVDYSSWGWQFTLELPPGTEVVPIPPRDEDDDNSD